MDSVILSKIPDICTREDLVQHFSTAVASGDIDYILYPLGKDITRALVAFKNKRAAEQVLRQSIIVFGVTLKSRPAPRQTYQRCTADVDPVILACIPDLQECIKQLQDEFGVDVNFVHDGGTMVLSGSLVQIQCAQTRLDNIFREQQETQARELLMVEQDLTTPRSQRTMSLESNEIRQSQGQMTQTAPVPRAQSSRENRFTNTMHSGRLYDQRPHTSNEMRRSNEFSGTSRSVESMYELNRSSKTKKGSRKEHKGLPQGLPHDDSFVVKGVKIQRHSASEDFGTSTVEGDRPTDYRQVENGSNPLRHTVPAYAWGDTFTQPNSGYVPSKKKSSSKSRHGPLSSTTASQVFKSAQRAEPHIPEAKEGVKVSKDGTQYLSLTIELDADVMGYIKKIHKPEIKEIELGHQVQFSNRWCDDVMELRMTTMYSAEEGGNQRLHEAKEAFIGFYQTVFYSVVKESVKYNIDKVPEAEVDAVTTAVGKAFASRVYVNSRNRGEIILVGSWDYLPLVKEWVNKKLVNKNSQGKKSQGNVMQTTKSSREKSSKYNKNKNVDKPSYNTWIAPDQGQNKSDKFGMTMPVKASIAEGYVRSAGALDRAFEDSINSTAEAPHEGLYYEHKMGDNLKVFIYKADITQATTDVIVNASNESLHHIGNIAAAISEAAGPEMQQQCTAYVSKYGPLKVSEVMCTPASGHLQCKEVIHSVGPMWCLFTNKEKCAEVLKQTFINTLFYANNKLKASSLTMPAISTGVYGIPLDVCTRSMYEAIHSFSRASSSLREIHVVDLEEEAAGMMSVIFQQLSEGEEYRQGDPNEEEGMESDEDNTKLKVKDKVSGGSLIGDEGSASDLTEDKGSDLEQRDDVLRSVNTDHQYASAPPVLGRQETDDWPESPPQSPPVNDMEGPHSPPPSPDDDYEEPLSRSVQAKLESQIHAMIQPEQFEEQQNVPPGISSPGNLLSPRAESLVSHHSEEVSRTTVISVHHPPPPVASPRSVHSLYSPRSDSLPSHRLGSDTFSPRPESVVSHLSEEIVRTDAVDTNTAPINFQSYSPRDGHIPSVHSSRAGSVKSVTSPRAELVSPRERSKLNDFTNLKSGEVTPKSGRYRSPGMSPRPDQIKSPGMSPRSDQFKSPGMSPRSDQFKSPGMSPRPDQIKSPGMSPRPNQIKSPGMSPRPDQIKSPRAMSLKSGEVTPRSDRFKSPITSPRQDDFHSPRAQSVKSDKQSPRPTSNNSLHSPIDDFFSSSTIKKHDSKLPGQTSQADSFSSPITSPRGDDIIQPQKATEDMAYRANKAENLSPRNLIVPNSTPVTELAPKFESGESRQSSAMQESLPEAESRLLNQVHLDSAASTLEDVTKRPKVKSPSSSFSEVFDQTAMQNVPLLIRVVASCICIAEKAGDIIRNIMDKGDLGIVEKGVNDLQTEADRSAERSIVASLNKQFPNICVIGEEKTDVNVEVDSDFIETSQSVEVLQCAREVPDHLRNIEPKDVVIWVDPVDGTNEYTEGLLDHVTTLIGISIQGKAVAGIISQPYYNYQSGPDAHLGRTIWGITGMGVFGMDVLPPPKEQRIICTTRSHSNKNVNLSVDSCEPNEVLRVGGSGHKVMLLLEGKSNAYVFASPGTKKWDTCAPEAVLHASGGTLTDIHGNYFMYDATVQVKNTGGVLATAYEEEHSWYTSKIPPAVLEDLKSEGPAVWQLADQLTTKLKMVEAPLLLKLVAASVSIAERAGEIVREIMKQGELGIVEKGVNDLQTEADRSAQECILASLRKQFSGITVIGEEDEDPNKKSKWVEIGQSSAVLEFANRLPEDLKNVNLEDVVVWVDPLDGTAEYTQGLLDHVTVLIGISVKGCAEAGVVYQPFYNYQAGPDATLGRTIWGVVGIGAFGLEPKQPPQGENIICTTRSHGNRNVTLSVEACQPSEVLRVGGSGHKVLLLLEGLSHAYVFATPGTKKWDTCAPEAILHAVGGTMTDMLGNSFQYNKDIQRKNNAGVLATPHGVDHRWYAEKIPDEVKDTLTSDGPAPWQQRDESSREMEDESEGETTPRY